MKLNNLAFDDNFIYAQDETGRMYKQSLLWYPILKSATDEQRRNYTTGFDGFHWRELDEDISFESFTYKDAVPSAFQEFFLTHKEINVSEFAKRAGINATLMRSYIYGFKRPSKIREQQIINTIHEIGNEYVTFMLSNIDEFNRKSTLPTLKLSTPLSKYKGSVRQITKQEVDNDPRLQHLLGYD